MDWFLYEMSQTQIPWKWIQHRLFAESLFEEEKKGKSKSLWLHEGFQALTINGRQSPQSCSGRRWEARQRAAHDSRKLLLLSEKSLQLTWCTVVSPSGPQKPPPSDQTVDHTNRSGKSKGRLWDYSQWKLKVEFGILEKYCYNSRENNFSSFCRRKEKQMNQTSLGV